MSDIAIFVLKGDIKLQLTVEWDVELPSIITTLFCNCSGQHGRFSVVGESSLRIDSVTEADSALYTCRASNQQDFVDAHALLRVQGNV